MRLYSTNSPGRFYTLREAVMKGLPNDRGLFMPENIPQLSPSFLENVTNYSFREIAFEVSSNLFQGAIPLADLHEIIWKSIHFQAPVIHLTGNKYVLELFHGPSLAFKDFGASFMANLMAYYNKEEQEELTILVATSGDTGGAVAAGFLHTPGIRVIILYPSGKVSDLQEKQLTSFGGNITAVEIAGTFDDCQTLVKQAFLDSELSRTLRLSSANSINIARLIPQCFYFFEAYKQLRQVSMPIVFSVPSGNFGNLTAGLIAKKMGLPVDHFIAATNINDVVPKYLASGVFSPQPSLSTISNAMDVGNPSNFARMLDLFSSTWNQMCSAISGFGFTDDETRSAIKSVFESTGYVLDPHGAVGYLALNKYQENHPESCGVFLETAHPGKFHQVVEDILLSKIEIPERLAVLKHKSKYSVPLLPDFKTFKSWLLEYGK